MKFRIVQLAAVILALIPAAAALAQENTRVAVIHIRAIDGLNASASSVQVVRDDQFTAGSRFRVSRAAVPSLEGIKTLVLIERRTDSMSGNELVQRYTHQVVAVGGDQFTVRGLDGKDWSYTADVLQDGSVDVIGPGDRIVVRGGRDYHIWKIEKTALLDRARIALY